MYFSLRFSNWCRQSRHYNATHFLSLHCMSKPFHTQVDSLSDEGNSEYSLPISLLDDLCLDLCPCTTARARCCDIAHLLKYCTSQCHMKNHMPRIWLVVQDPELSSQKKNQGMARSVPDPFPSARMGSGNETTCSLIPRHYSQLIHPSIILCWKDQGAWGQG